jgi:hypothetical protein
MAVNDPPAWVRPFAERDHESRTEAAQLARSLDASALARATGDTGWTVRDEITHMATADADFIPLLRAIISGEQPDTSVFADTDARNARNLEENRGRPAGDIARELEENGRTIAELFATLSDADETRQPAGFPFPLIGLIDGYSQHHQYHVGQIKSATGREA